MGRFLCIILCHELQTDRKKYGQKDTERQTDTDRQKRRKIEIETQRERESTYA